MTQNFFSMTQQAGQGKGAFAKAVKLAANKSDISSLTLQDVLCLVIPTGCKDARLREKMSELEELTIAAFNTSIDAHMHSKATSIAASSAGANSQSNQSRGGNGQGKQGGQSGQSGQQNRQSISDAERKRRQIMKGKCFRCASANHFANYCSFEKDIKCKKWNNLGHIAAAYVSPGAKANVTSNQDRDQDRESTGVLQLEYPSASQTQEKYTKSRAAGNTYYTPVHTVPFPAEKVQPGYYADSCVVIKNTDCNWPTPNMLL